MSPPDTAVEDAKCEDLEKLGVVASSLHQKVKFPSGDQVFKICGCQSTARQCVVAAISHQLDAESSVSAEREL